MKKQIRIRGFTYYKDVPHPSIPGEEIRQAAFAVRGEIVDLSPEDVKRGEEVSAFGDPLEDTSGAPSDFLVVDVSDDEIDEYLEEEKPTVDETVALAQGDPDSAQRLLDAESRVSGGEPRQGVVDGLQKVIDG